MAHVVRRRCIHVTCGESGVAVFSKCNQSTHHKMGLVIARGSCMWNSHIDVRSKSPAGHNMRVRRRPGGQLLLVCAARNNSVVCLWMWTQASFTLAVSEGKARSPVTYEGAQEGWAWKQWVLAPGSLFCQPSHSSHTQSAALAPRHFPAPNNSRQLSLRRGLPNCFLSLLPCFRAACKWMERGTRGGTFVVADAFMRPEY